MSWAATTATTTPSFPAAYPWASTESQSRFYENIIGRSPAFVHAIFPYVKEHFPQQLENVTEEMFYRAVNKAQPSLIRTEADELTYCLHIMVRYELEKRLIAGTLAIKDLPEAWNKLYKEYLGLDVPSDREGCLQDSPLVLRRHWLFPQLRPWQRLRSPDAQRHGTGSGGCIRSRRQR